MVKLCQRTLGNIGFSAVTAGRERSPSYIPATKRKEIERGFSKPVKMEEVDKVDYFDRIPEEVLLLILSRLEDLKYMCGCSLVSKRFALTIYQIKSVYLTLPSTEIHSTPSVVEIHQLFPKLAGFTSEEITRFIKSSPIKELKFLSFLRNFRELRSISLEFTCPRSLCSSPLFKMRVKFSSGGALVEHFVLLVDDEQGYERPFDDTISDTFFLFGCFFIWSLVLSLLVKSHPLLVSVTITNGKKQGKLDVSDIELVAWRKNFVPASLLDGTLSSICNSNIPESGYLLKVMTYVIDNPADEPDPDSGTVDDSDAITWEYAGDEKLLPGALKEFIRKYGDSFD